MVAKSSTVVAAGSIVTGAAMTTVPIKILGLFTVETTSVFSAPLLTVVTGGAVDGGAAAASLEYR